MELALSLGDTPKPFSFLDKPQKKNNSVVDKDHLGFCMAVGKDDEIYDTSKAIGSKLEDDRRKVSCSSSPDPPVQLDLLPLCPPVHRSHQSTSSKKFPNFHWLNENFGGEPERAEDSSPNSTTVSWFHRMDSARFMKGKRGFEGIVGEERAEDSSPNSTTVSSFHRMDSARFMKGKRGFEGIVGNVNGGEADRGRSYSRGIISYEEETNNVNGDHDINMGRKKLRLSKEQSAFLEESFKEHSTLNPKQKFALAKQLNLHTRQVEVWFQNRRARTKLKQTEFDCEHLKRCFETLTEENKRLQKELQELRALKASKPFYMQLPATTLTMCPSCERVAATTTGTADTLATTTTAAAASKPTKTLSLSPPRTNCQQTDHS